MTPSRRDERYEPLPGPLKLPAHLVRKLGPRGRLVLALVVSVALAAAIAAAIVLVPEIGQTKSENAERDRREAAQRREALRGRLIAEQRPQRGRSRQMSAAGRSARLAVLADLEAQILADARRRVRSGTLKPPPAIRAECEALRHAPDPLKQLGRRRGRYSCLAITTEVPRSELSSGGVLGHPFQALVDFRGGRFTWCKVSGRPAEGGYTSEPLVGVPRACGGR